MSPGPIVVLDVIRYLSDRIGDYDKPESLSKWCEKAMKENPSFIFRNTSCMITVVSNNLKNIEKLEGYSLMEKLQLAFIFSRPVSNRFVKLLKKSKFRINQDEKKRICRLSTEDGSIVRFSDHHPGVKYFQGVLCQNNHWKGYMNNQRIAREKKQGQQDVENGNTGSEMTDGPETMEPTLEEIDAEIEREQEKGQPGVENENPNPDAAQIKKQRVESIPFERKREEIDEEVKKEQFEDIPIDKEPKQEADEDTTVEADIGQRAFNERINYEDLDAQEFVYPGFPEDLKPETSVRLQKRHQNSTTDTGKRVKTSDSIATSSNQKTHTTSSNASMQQPLQKATPAIPTPDKPKISVLALATHIESIALFYNLKSLQKKASLAVKKMKQMKKSGRDETLSVRNFYFLVGSMLVCLEANKIRKTDTSISMESLLKNLQLFLIRPLGSEIVHEALEMVAQKIRDFENKEDRVPPTIISESLTHLLMATGF
ncbi:unnamed protein product [Caenorhabditis nigoni]